ncbi:PfkB family carbohydrate kinase [Microbacterium testaceum]|uniref:PfkB family carbohydrate kinase n=1 Tax=Microbacterium testaceum TaxID=2033 RepID=UPI0022E96812|nr:PfkB family carbohydrate kinase [Microbacterium testaceum]
MSGRIVVIGDALIDEIRDDAGVREFVGGAGLNVAVGLSRLGVPASLIAMVGDDAAGEQIRAYLAEYDVELLASPAAHGSSRAVSTRSSEGEPQYVFNDAAQNRRVAYGAAERAAIAAAPMVVASCFPFDDREQTDALVDAVASAGTPLAIDPNPRSGMLHDRDEFVRGFERAAAGALLVKVGEDDAQLLYGTSLDDLRDRLTGLGVDAVLATYGAGGAAIVAGDVTVSRGISNLPGRIVDTMGGGDAVLATTAALVRERLPEVAADWDAVLSRAMDVAAATCRSEGALLRTPE